MANLTDKFELKQNGFIYEATEPTSAAMAMLPQNRTLLVAELTDTAPAKPALTYELETVEAVFEHFKPGVKVEFADEQGASVNEKLEFKNVGDFGKKALIDQSALLGTLDDKEKEHLSFARKLQSNKVLQKILSDPAKKTAYITMLQALIQELEDAGV